MAHATFFRIFETPNRPKGLNSAKGFLREKTKDVITPILYHSI